MTDDNYSQHKDLERMIELLKIIREEPPNAAIGPLDPNDFYQLKLLKDGGLVEFDYKVADGTMFFLTRLNIKDQGHTFLETVEHEDSKNKFIKYLKEKDFELSKIPARLLGNVAEAYIKSQIGF